MSTRRKRPSGNPARRVTSLGQRIEVARKYRADFQEPRPGEHLWIVTGAWRVADPTAAQLILDHENLLSIDGPGCYVCEEPWSRERAGQPCPGDPSSIGGR